MAHQLTLEGMTLKAQGCADAIQALPEWSERARETALRLAEKQATITSEDVTDVVGLPRLPRANRNNAVGAVFVGLKDRLYRVGFVPARNPQAHGRLIAKWAMRRDNS